MRVGLCEGFRVLCGRVQGFQGVVWRGCVRVSGCDVVRACEGFRVCCLVWGWAALGRGVFAF